jgi:Mor family transcriptional regulator
MRVYDIWKDPFFDFARSKPERLLLAAIDYSVEKHVVYVAADPPSGWCISMAAKTGKKIIYLPIGTFSPVTLKKLKEFHVLDGHHVRRYARQYI